MSTRFNAPIRLYSGAWFKVLHDSLSLTSPICALRLFTINFFNLPINKTQGPTISTSTTLALSSIFTSDLQRFRRLSQKHHQYSGTIITPIADFFSPRNLDKMFKRPRRLSKCT